MTLDKLDKESVASISSYFYEEFLKNSDKYKNVSYFRRSPGGKLLMFKIMQKHFLNERLCVEELIRQVPISIASRLSLFTMIDIAVKKGIIEKKSLDHSDKRKKHILPTDSFIKEYKDWLRDYLSEINS